MREIKNWHNKTSDETLAVLDTSLNGLSEEEAQQRLQTFGPNKLPEHPQRNILLRFLNNSVLYFEALVCLLLYIRTLSSHWERKAVSK